MSNLLGTHRKEGREPLGGGGEGSGKMFFSGARKCHLPCRFSKGKFHKSKHEKSLTIQSFFSYLSTFGNTDI